MASGMAGSGCPAVPRILCLPAWLRLQACSALGVARWLLNSRANPHQFSTLAERGLLLPKVQIQVLGRSFADALEPRATSDHVAILSSWRWRRLCLSQHGRRVGEKSFSKGKVDGPAGRRKRC